MIPPPATSPICRAARRFVARRKSPVRWTVAVWTSCWLMVLASACAERPASDHRPVVAVSVPPQAYFVKRLADDLVRTEVMIPPGSSPHTHDPDIAQVRAASDASLYLMVGHRSFPFEQTWLERLLAENRNVRIVDCSAELDDREGDPHVWLSPRAVRAIVPKIAAALIDLLPAHREEIVTREEDFIGEIDRLDSDIRSSLAGGKKRFYVFHPAWGYFARDYGLEQIPIEVDNKEPDPRQLAQLIQQAEQEKVKVIFVQPQFSRRSAELVAEEIGAKVVVVDPLAYDWETNLRRAAAAFRQGLS